MRKMKISYDESVFHIYVKVIRQEICDFLMNNYYFRELDDIM